MPPEDLDPGGAEKSADRGGNPYSVGRDQIHPASRSLLHGRVNPDRFPACGHIGEHTITPYDLLIGNGSSWHDLALTAPRHPPGRRPPRVT